MKTWIRVASITLAMVSAWPAAVAAADRYPAKPIRIVVPFTPGGSNDLVARVIAQRFNEAWKQPVVIDNRPGGGSTIGIEIVVRAAADGYTLLVTSGGIAINVSLYRLPFNPVTDLAPVALGVTALSGTPEALGDYLKFEVGRWARLIKEAGIKLE